MSVSFKNLELMNYADCEKFHTEALYILKNKNLLSHNITIEVSKRCKRVAGNITVSKPSAKIVKINVSYDYYTKFGINRSIGTLRHEISHLIAYNKLGFMDHGEYFKSVCHELGGTMNPDMAGFSYSASACNEYIRGNIKGYKYVYSCPNCSNKIERTRKLSESTKRKVCGTCRTSVSKWKEEMIIL